MKPVIRRPGEDIDHLIRRFRRKVDREGILDDYRRRGEFVKPSEQKRKRRAELIRDAKRA